MLYTKPNNLPLTNEKSVLGYNNFYEFTKQKTKVRNVAKNFRLSSYELQVDGLVDKPVVWDIDKIKKLGLEERIYRFRCVERWSMIVPWIGVPLKALLQKCDVKKNAKYVAFTSFYDPQQAPGQRNKNYTWPYYEALRIDEAMNELAFVVIGVYGKELRPQNGAPLRIILPWKYGYKSAKSVVKMTLLSEMPGTFWSDRVPHEYSFLGNVEPDVPHPRWSQEYEHLFHMEKKIPTLPYNGYANEVSHLY
jgi:sulfoxide reductase catalytic subunit YedY